MLHELLLALLGHPGDIFVLHTPAQPTDSDENLPPRGSIQLAPDLPIAEVSETHRLNEIVRFHPLFMYSICPPRS
jgi:hypothetical protein